MAEKYFFEKDFFELEALDESNLAPTEPQYFYRHFRLWIRDRSGELEIGDKGYTLDEEFIDEIKNFISANIKIIKKFSRLKVEKDSGTWLTTIIDGKIYHVPNPMKVAIDSISFDKKIFTPLVAFSNRAVAEGDAYVCDSSPDPKKRVEQAKINSKQPHLNNIERKIDFLKTKITTHLKMLEQLKHEKPIARCPLVNNCLNEIIVHPYLHNYDAQNYILPTLANKNPRQVDQLSAEEIAKQCIFFNRYDYHHGSDSSWLAEDGQIYMFIELFARYCSFYEAEAAKKIAKYETLLN